MGFFVRLMVALLLPFKIKLVTLNCSSLMNFLIQTFFFATWLIVIYSILVVEVDTVFCFLLNYNITASFRKKKYSITDFLPFGSLAKLLSLYPMRPYSIGVVEKLPSDFYLYISSRWIVYLK